MNQLGEHLMVLYGCGQLGLDDDEELLRRFLACSNSDVRRHAIGFVGQILESDEKVPEDVLERFELLWDLYWAGAGKEDAAEKPDACLFGAWFACGQFPEQWALDQLKQFVEVVPIPEPDHAVAEQLAAIGHTDIVKATRIMDRMIRGDREGWHVYGWRESAMQVLRNAMSAGGEAMVNAVQLIDFLGRRGYVEFGSLLNQQE